MTHTAVGDATLPTLLAEVRSVLDRIDGSDLAVVAGDLNSHQRVYVTGEGRSGLMAKAFAMRLMHLGFTVHVLGETTTPALSAPGALVGVSGSGTTSTTVNAAKQAHQLGLDVYAVTSDPDSPLAALATRPLVIPAATKWRRPGEPDTVQPLGSLFDQCTHLVLDAVCLHLAGLRDIDNDAARTRHASE